MHLQHHETYVPMMDDLSVMFKKYDSENVAIEIDREKEEKRIFSGRNIFPLEYFPAGIFSVWNIQDG